MGGVRERPWVRLALLGALLVTAVVVAVVVGVPPVDEIRAAVAAAGWAGPVVFAAAYAAITLTPATAAALSLTAGVLFGVPVGLAVVMAGAVTSACVAFWIARSLGRAAVRGVDNARLARLDRLLRRRGLLAVLGVRLVPLLPFAPLNYACGLVGVRWRDYVPGTALGILPGCSFSVTLGAYGSTPTSAPFMAAVAGVVLLSVGGMVMARRRS
jgi:uncharacterized membrane protein YdjX (TVP38/TMEM64 family)